MMWRFLHFSQFYRCFWMVLLLAAASARAQAQSAPRLTKAAGRTPKTTVAKKPATTAQENKLLDGLDNLGPKPAAAPTAIVDVPARPPTETAAPAVNNNAAPSVDLLKAVPRKPVLRRHRLEFSPTFGASLNDAYYQHLAYGGNLIFYPHDSFGVGVGADYLFFHGGVESSLELVRRTTTAVPATMSLARVFVHADIYALPIYGKVSLFNSVIIPFDFYASVGAALTSTALSGEDYAPASSFALGQRLYFTDWLALKVELRDYLYVQQTLVNKQTRSDVQNYFMLQVGLSMFLPSSFEYTY